MSMIHIVVLAVVQGITEFLPISSSAHLILVPVVFGWPDQGLLVDVAVHVGTLAAVIIYFWRDLLAMLVGLVHMLRGRRDVNARLALLIVVATIPVVIAGLFLNEVMSAGIRSIVVIAWANLVYAALLYVCDRFGRTDRTLDGITLKDAIIIGMAQALALVPGTSRSGVTMTAGRALGFARTEAARFSLLTSVPTILAAGLLAGLDIYRAGDQALTSAAVTAGALAFVAALGAIALMMAWLRHASFTPFVVYRIVLGVLLLGFAYGVVG
jgi:undecaprenyl-diphosphatase